MAVAKDPREYRFFETDSGERLVVVDEESEIRR